MARNLPQYHLQTPNTIPDHRRQILRISSTLSNSGARRRFELFTQICADGSPPPPTTLRLISRLRLANEPPASTWLVLLSLLDGTLPILYSVVAPHAIEGLAVEPRSGRIFAARSRASASATPVSLSGVGAGAGAANAAGGPVVLGNDVVGAASASTASAGGFPWGTASPLTGGGAAREAKHVAGSGAGAWDGPAAKGFVGDGGNAGAVSVLALASGTFLDRGPLR